MNEPSHPLDCLPPPLLEDVARHLHDYRQLADDRLDTLASAAEAAAQLYGEEPLRQARIRAWLAIRRAGRGRALNCLLPIVEGDLPFGLLAQDLVSAEDKQMLMEAWRTLQKFPSLPREA